ncbi:hypothetical protein ACFXK0_28340 [Nocardia sp. NPDC059177]|uniref:hypothetical protein n=1 Tax=Nocardia sp. NPDC059177 TaxID=3346759 RepID=UPI0036CFC3F9
MSSGSDDRRNDPTVFGGPGAPQQQPDPRRPDASTPAPGTPDATAVWTPGSTGLPPTLRWDGSGPPPGLPDPTPWTPAGPQDWQGGPAQPGANPPAGQQGSPWPAADATQVAPWSGGSAGQPGAPSPGANPPAGQPGTPWPAADATQVAPWSGPPAGQPGAPSPGANPPAGQPGSPWPAADATQVAPWSGGPTGQPGTPPPGTNPPAGQPVSPWPAADQTQIAPWSGTNTPPGQAGSPQGSADATQLRGPAAPQQQWGASPGGQQWNPAAGQPNPQQQWGQGASAWQPPPQQYGEVPPLEQYGAQPYGQPGYGQPVPPKSSGKTVLWAVLGVAALVIAGGTVTAVALSGGDSTDTNADSGATPSMVSALTTSAAPSTTSKPKPTTTTTKPTGAAAGQQPLIEGYQVVASPDRGAAYDVPPSWKVATESTIGGFGEPPGESVIGKGYASDGRDYCPGSTRTVSLLTGSDLSDHAAAGAELGRKTAPLAYNGSTGTPGPAEPLTSMDGRTQGMFTETTGTVPNPKAGCASTYSIYTYAFKGSRDGSFVMVMVADTGVPDAIDAATAKRIFSSIRAL